VVHHTYYWSILLGINSTRWCLITITTWEVYTACHVPQSNHTNIHPALTTKKCIVHTALPLHKHLQATVNESVFTLYFQIIQVYYLISIENGTKTSKADKHLSTYWYKNASRKTKTRHFECIDLLLQRYTCIQTYHYQKPSHP